MPPEPAAWKLKDGTVVLIRPICPDDEPLMVRFHQGLSPDSVYFRYLSPLKLSLRIEHRRLVRVCTADYEHELALVAVEHDSRADDERIIGVARLIRFPERNEAEFAVVVSDAHQGSGLGTHLLRELVEVVKREKYTRVFGYVLPDNRPMLHICDRLGFERIHPLGDPVVKVELRLPQGNRFKPRSS